MSGTNIGNRYVSPLQQVVDPTGVPYVGAQLFTYATGTSTLQSTYSDVGMTVANSNPILTNSAGFFPNIFMVSAPAYRLRLLDPTGGVIWDCDPCSGVPTTGYGSYVPGMIPIGGIIPFAGGTPPTGFFLCDGSAVSRTVFAPLFAVLGTTFGAGDGATTFNIPDLRGRVVAGVDVMGGVAAGRLTAGNSGVNGAALGGSGGSELLQTHQHPITDVSHNHNDPGHVHAWAGDNPPIRYPHPSGALAASGTFSFDFSTTDMNSANVNLDPATTGLSHTEDFGGGGSGNVQPSLVVNYCVFHG